MGGCDVSWGRDHGVGSRVQSSDTAAVELSVSERTMAETVGSSNDEVEKNDGKQA